MAHSLKVNTLTASAAAPAALAKLSRPRLFGALPRERLFAVLDQALAHPLVWVDGPPGAGKTTLVASYLESRRLPGLWYHVDGGDADPATFFYYLGRAASQTIPAKHKPLPLLTPEYLGDLTGFSRRFFRELYTHMPRPGVLVLDNYDEVFGEVAFHALLVDSAHEIPDGINVIIVSRTEPPSLYTRLIANRTVTRIGWDELRLTPEETRAIVSAARAPDEALIEALYRQSGGWAAGLTLMLERIRRSRATPQHVEAESREAVFNYFAGEILDKAPPEHQKILLTTAFLPRVTAGIAEQISECAQAGRLLNDLYRRQLFTDRRAGAQITYQYHDLFREFLLARAEETYPLDELQALARRAAQILENDGQVEEAIELYQRAGQWQSVIELTLRQAPQLLAQGRGQTLRERITGLPAEQVSANPWLVYWHGTSLIQLDQPQARRTLEQAFERFGALGDDTGQMLAASGIIEAYHFEWSEFKALDRWIDALDRLLARNPAFSSEEVELRIRSGLLIALVRRKPEHLLLPVCIHRVTALLEADLEVNQRITAAAALILSYTLGLDRDAPKPIVRLVEPLLASQQVTPLNRVFWLLRLAQYLWLALDHDGATAALAEASDLAESHGLTITEGYRRLVGHLLYFATSEHSAMEANIQSLKNAVNPMRPLDMGVLQRALSDYALAQRDTALAVEHAQTAVTLADQSGSKPNQGQWRVLLAAMLVEDGRDAEALDCLDAARSLISGAWYDRMMCDLYLVDACIALKRRDLARCHSSLGSAFCVPSGEFFASLVFIFHPALMSGLCAEALRAGIRSEYVKGLIRQYRLVPASPDAEAWPWPIMIYTLGGFRVLKAGEEIRFARKTQKKPLELLQALIAYGGGDVAVSALTESLWSDAEGDAAYHAFENTLYRLRQLLGSGDAIRLSGGKVSLDPGRCWVDVWALERRLDQARGAAGSQTELDAVMNLYRGHFLGQEGQQPWALPARERLRDKFLRHLLSAAQSYERAREWNAAAAIYQRGIELDNLAEALYRGLMVCYRELGDHAEALRVYRRCRELLSVVLGVQPTAETQAIYQSLTHA
jgi:LuxR family maltose regulon positive regulatory protein